jgi:hypothetical protein
VLRIGDRWSTLLFDATSAVARNAERSSTSIERSGTPFEACQRVRHWLDSPLDQRAIVVAQSKSNEACLALSPW